jgi:hypothetical protein
LLNLKDFASVIKELKKNFNILEIDWKKVFSYDNVYMDTKDYLFYNQHQNKLNSRVKVRTRFYVDANSAFFEFKHKINWVTNKYRYEFPSHEHWFMTRWKKRFFDWVWQSIYNEKSPEISPSIKTNYKRITLVSKKWDERVTIDFNIKARDLRKKDAKIVDLKNLIIVESKSMKSISMADNLMKNYGIKRIFNCSKYSLWIIYSGLAERYDTFQETIKKIKQIRMETVRIWRIKDTQRNASLDKIIKNIKRDTSKKVIIQLENKTVSTT